MRAIVFSLLSLFAIGISGCADEDPGFSNTFSASNTIAPSDSIFSKLALSKSGEQVAGEFRIKVVSVGVSSGAVSLNSEELMSPSDFHNNSFQKTMTVALFEQNDISVKINGKPGDQLCVRVFELVDADHDGQFETERGIFEDCVDRTAGPPNTIDVTIEA